MAKNTYETLLILDSNHYARDPGGISKQIETMFTEAGADVQVSRLWEERKLAYPIKGHQKGTYWLVYSEMEGPALPLLERSLQLAEPVMRELTIKLDPRLVEPILANARGETVASDGDGEEAVEGEGEAVAAQPVEA